MSHGTFLDFTPNNEYKEPLEKKTKRLYKNNQSTLSDFKTFQMFDNENKVSSLHDRTRMKSTNNLQAEIITQEKQQNNNNHTCEVRLLKPSDPSLNSTNKKDLKYSSRNNMESHSYLNDLSNLIILLFFININLFKE
jgi:hypothetical protein